MSALQFVMITGASSGVGLSATLLFSRMGYEVLACVQNETEKQVLEQHVNVPVHILITELRDQNTIEAAVEDAARIVGSQGLACLVNCAAMLHCGPMEAPISCGGTDLLSDQINQLKINKKMLKVGSI